VEGGKDASGVPQVVKEAKFPEFSEAVLDRVEVGAKVTNRRTIQRLHDFIFVAGDFAVAK